jgi:hypothetical protein
MLSALVLGRAHALEVSLPCPGRIVIGRSSLADIVLDEPSVSRVHAALLVDPSGALRIEDLGSQNGTVVRARRLGDGDSARVEPGEPVALAGAHVIVQRGPPTCGERLWSPRRLAAALGWACAVSQFHGKESGPAVVHVRLERSDLSVAREVLGAFAAPAEAIAPSAPGELDLLVPCPDDSGTELARRIAAALRDRGLGAHVGIGAFGRDGASGPALLAAARVPRRHGSA